jgi:ADP-ribose pyrophosphatase YjhB (NUDIX family)
LKPDFYYLESDGQVFLVRHKKKWGFPRTRQELPCAFTPVFTIPLPEGNVLFAKPILKNHPAHWFHKDHVIGQKDIEPMVQQAINRTLARGAAKVAIIEDGKVLMVKAARGYTAGYWNLPGGFMGYGEHPEESAKREALEEIGVRVKLIRLIGIYAETFPKNGGYMLSFVYLGKRLTKRLKPHPEEIAELAWFPLREAMRMTHNPFARSGLRDYLKSIRQKP